MKFMHSTIKDIEDLIIHKAGKVEDEIIALSERLKNKEYRDEADRGKIKERLKLAKYQRYLIYGKAHHLIMRHNTALEMIFAEDKGLLVNLGEYISSLEEVQRYLSENIKGDHESLALAERSLSHARHLAPKIEHEIRKEIGEAKQLE